MSLEDESAKIAGEDSSSSSKTSKKGGARTTQDINPHLVQLFFIGPLCFQKDRYHTEEPKRASEEIEEHLNLILVLSLFDVYIEIDGYFVKSI
jgi:hypothetical protein